jgi:PhoH-like ATPase
VAQLLHVSDFKGWNEWYENGIIPLRSLSIDESEVHENQGVILEGLDNVQYGLVKGHCIVQARHYYPCNISPKNEEQHLAVSMLADKDISLLILSGVAGSGKTLLACAHAMEQYRKGNVSKIVIAKSMTPVGREIGFLKGGMEEKVKPWLGPFYDNFIQCNVAPMELERMQEQDALEITPITFIQGRSIPNAIIIIDEVQNLEMNVLKQIITRAAENTRIILLGDQSQVFERSLKDKSIKELIVKAENSPLTASIHLDKSLRSPIADWAVATL